ncbi:MAG: M48 family metallopeptidase [Flavobacteriales bacterium]|jgi:STE24 endopeptidase|uniref:M48 family metallopeptidase n=1 Tax=Candidatus Ulvibacter alkanivorans TaxID=2267620 RepID=UPI000DF269A2|nr:M48 family metallopeptidase [Candidatus Ulvibacter alkanivorans]MCH2490912.1 M48 family metallopeptidase [Flavobacteriales bacterium]
MNPTSLFYLLIGILILNFIVDKTLSYLNAKHYNDPIPEPLKDVYDTDEYRKSQEYKKEQYRFSMFSATISLVATLLFFFLDGFAYVDALARSLVSGAVWVGLVFFGIILLASDLVSIPFNYYRTFVIEEKYGFNKTTIKTFVLDKLKGWIMLLVLGAPLLALIIWFYETTGADFWLYAWAVLTLFSVIMNMFYAKLIVPLFNKQTPLDAGSLRTKIEVYARSVGFTIDKIFVIDGSKRSTKANAYFSGFGSEKRITLYDTLIKDLEEEEIVAVLAHEVGHYKKHHILFNLAASILTTGLMLWLLSLFVGSSVLSEALNVSQPSFHIGLIAFGILYTPISEITGLLMNYLSRVFEYQADNYAKTTYRWQPLISALKKLSKNSLSNLTPHPAYVFMNYSHPTLLQRFQNLKKDSDNPTIA